MYHDKLPDMSAAYAEIQEKMAKKDHDGDGKIETGKEEYFGARDKAIKKAMGKKVAKEHHQKDENGKVIEHDGQGEVEQIDEISASGYARAKKYREDQAREKDKKEQEYFAAKAKTHKWDGKKWTKKESVEHDVEDVEEAYTVTNADKKANTPAYQNFKKGMKSKTTGKPMYKAADHMKEEEIHPDDNVLSPEELERVAELSREWDAKMEEGYGGKPMMSKGGEVKPPRTAKGAMAYDGPNKAASEAKDRLVAKAKAKREAMKK